MEVRRRFQTSSRGMVQFAARPKVSNFVAPCARGPCRCVMMVMYDVYDPVFSETRESSASGRI